MAQRQEILQAIYEADRLHAQFRMDVNNPFNAVRWGDPNTSITSASYGAVTSVADPRKIQLSLAVKF